PRFSVSLTAPPSSSPLSLHDALPICLRRLPAAALVLVQDLLVHRRRLFGDAGPRVPLPHFPLRRLAQGVGQAVGGKHRQHGLGQDRKSTRLNSSHVKISYAVFCLKKK